MVWGKAGSTTLTSTADVITVDSLSNNKCIMILNNVFSSGQGKLEPTLNNDTGSNYALRYALDGATEVTMTSKPDFENTTGGFTNGLTFHVQYLVNISTEEKLLISHSNEVETTGAGTAPRRREYVGKWVNTSDAVSRYDVPNVGSGDFASDSNSTVLGSDLTPGAAITFAPNAQLGSRAEITDSRKMYSFSDISTSELKAYYNFDSTSGGLVNQATTGDGLGSSADGTNSNITLDTTNEKLGTGAYSFNGSSSVVEIGGQTTFTEINNPNQISTIVFWYKSSSSPSSTYDKIMGTIDQSVSDRGFNIMRTGSSGGGMVSLTQAGGNKGLNDFTTTTGLFPVDGNWYHYAFKFDNLAGKLSIYKDGSLFEEENYASWTPATGGNTQRPFQFGKDTSNSKWFNGQLDDSAIYYRGLTVSEISFLYNSGTGATVDNAKGWQEIGT